MDAIKRISRYVLFLMAVSFVFIPSRSGPSQKITWQGVAFDILWSGVILDNLLIIIGISRRRIQAYLELILYSSLIISFILILLTGTSKVISALTAPEIKAVGGHRPLMVITFLIPCFLILSCSVLAVIDAKNILLKFKNNSLNN